MRKLAAMFFRTSRHFLARMILLMNVALFSAAMFLSGSGTLHAQKVEIVWSDQEKPILQKIRGLRQVSDDARGRTTKQIALEIRVLPAAANKVRLALSLASLSTEGDFGHDTLQEVATTLAAALQEQPAADGHGGPAYAYIELAQLVHYEHVQASLDDPQFAAAMAKLDTDDGRRQAADFALQDLHGQTWALKDLRGKVVLVNFWATWCPPCRKEMPDLQSLYKKYKDKGLVILAVSDEESAKVKPFVAEQDVKYPILLDPGKKVGELFQVQGIPRTFVYDRSGKLVAQAIDMRTKKQFQEMLASAELK
jgi:peroxiredoxin